ncbi:MAG: right-handed parallel beta-helix repeat-containing protein [Phycisphaerales bacterium]
MSKAGPLNPPAGAVASTGKTIAEAEPRTAVNATNTPGGGSYTFRITQPGSYYLTGNIQTGGLTGGIEITASGVTLDLNGFTIDGGYAGGPGSPIYGVHINGTRSNVLITNGHVINCPGYGIAVSSSLSSSIVLRNLTVANAGIVTIDATCPGVRMSGCTVQGVAGGAGLGVQLGAGAVVEECVLRGLGNAGLVAQDGSTITDCTVAACTGAGFNVFGGSTVSRCTSLGNGGSGFVIGNACTVTGCTARSNTGSGFSAASGCTLHLCSADSNGAAGIAAVDHNLIDTCIATANGAAGISVRQGNTVRGNHSNAHSAAGAAGILLTSFTPGGNRVEGNNCEFNTRGYWRRARGTSSSATRRWGTPPIGRSPGATTCR